MNVTLVTGQNPRYGKDTLPLPALQSTGLLPAGIHEASLEEAQKHFAFNTVRRALWRKFLPFEAWARGLGTFECLYIGGGFVSQKPDPADLDTILQTRDPYGTTALESMQPFFLEGLLNIEKKYGVHLHFWMEGFPGGIHDFRQFFQYVRPQEAAPLGLPHGAMKGIVRIML